MEVEVYHGVLSGIGRDKELRRQVGESRRQEGQKQEVAWRRLLASGRLSLEVALMISSRTEE